MKSVDVCIRELPRSWQPPLRLDGWYGDPLTKAAAQRLRQSVRRALQRCYVEGGPRLDLQLLERITCFWLEGAVRPEFQSLGRALDQDQHRERALLELIYGQLLLSRKLTGAFDHLEAGFRLAAAGLDAHAYLQVMQRHARLAALHLTEYPMPARNLPSLLAEAAVIRRLTGSGWRSGGESGHGDTVG